MAFGVWTLDERYVDPTFMVKHADFDFVQFYFELWSKSFIIQIKVAQV